MKKKKWWLELQLAWHTGRIAWHEHKQDEILGKIQAITPAPDLCIVPRCGRPAVPQGLPAPGAPFCEKHGWGDVSSR